MNWVLDTCCMPCDVPLLCRLRDGKYEVLTFHFDNAYGQYLAFDKEGYVFADDLIKYCVIV